MLIGQDIAILGAGVAGLAAARALAFRGAKVTVYERAEAITAVGAGLHGAHRAAHGFKTL